MRALVLVALLSLPTAASAQDCTPSPLGDYSFIVRVAPGAGRRALYDVRVSTGATCDEGAVFGWATVGSRSRLALTDAGVLVSILAPRTSHRDWPIVMLTVVAPSAHDARTVRLSLDDFVDTRSLRGSVAVSYDGGEVVFTSRGGEARVAFAGLDVFALGSD